MSERPILFAGPLVRALLDGRKTQTRRLLGREARHVGFIGGSGERDDPARWGYWCEDSWGRWAVLARGLDEHHAHGSVSIPCPFGVPGDRLWVRECWGLVRPDDPTCWHRGSVRGLTRDDLRDWAIAYRADWGANQDACFWRPSILMPRWASRLASPIVDVRVERLQAISEEDARAEGVEPAIDILVGGEPTHRAAFAALWNSLASDGARWSDNPWVWALTFKRVEEGRDE
jgi:hypothetical protein